VLRLKRAPQLRLALAAGFLLLLGLYYASSEFLPDLPEWGDVLWVGLALSALAFAPVMLVLPLRRARPLALVALGFAAIAVVLYLIGADLYASLPKLAAAALLGFIFLRYCERLSWVVILALLIPVADTLSVWYGPTHYVVTEQPQIFDVSSVAFPVPGERAITLRWNAPVGASISGWLMYRRTDGGRELLLAPNPLCPPADHCGKKIVFSDRAKPAGKQLSYRVVTVSGGRESGKAIIVFPPVGEGASQITGMTGKLAPSHLRVSSAPSAPAGLGLPDVLFFALFLGAAVRFGLRYRATWLALVASLGLTTALAIYIDPFNIGGLPALPGLSLAFLLTNADLIWRRLNGGENIDIDVQSRPVPPAGR
jgi:hypothetical protein